VNSFAPHHCSRARCFVPRSVEAIEKKREIEKLEKSDFRFFSFSKLGPVQTGRPPPGEGADGVGVFAGLQHTPGIRQHPKAENWVPICALIWDPDPRLGPAFPAVAIWKWEVSARFADSPPGLILLEGPSLVIHTPKGRCAERQFQPGRPQWIRDMFEELKDMFEGLFPDAAKLDLEEMHRRLDEQQAQPMIVGT